MIERLRQLSISRSSPATAGTAIGVALVVFGFVVIWIAWAGTSRTLDVQSQLAFVVSGGFGALGLIAVGTAVLVIQSLRRLGAAERAAFREVIDQARDPR